MRNHTLMYAALCAASILPSFALAQERLLIEVVPVHVYPLGVFDGTASSNDRYKSPTIRAGEVLIAVHEAMVLLRVHSRHFDIVLSSHNAIGSDALECTYAEPDVPSQCNLVRGATLSQEEFDDLHKSLGHESPGDDPSLRQPGTIRLLILVKSDLFPWEAGTLMGTATIVSWNGWDPDDMHWSTMACTGWAHLSVPTIAHELGHCFGLEHNGAGDPNFDGVDNTIDLMTAYASVDKPSYLKTSNLIRVENHFGPKPAPSEMSKAPMSRTVY